VVVLLAALTALELLLELDDTSLLLLLNELLTSLLELE
jgi:hypothetical protein